MVDFWKNPLIIPYIINGISIDFIPLYPHNIVDFCYHIWPRNPGAFDAAQGSSSRAPRSGNITKNLPQGFADQYTVYVYIYIYMCVYI